MALRVVLVVLAQALLAARLLGQQPVQLNDQQLFEKQIKPFLTQHCFACHSQAVQKPKGDLRLDRLPVDFHDDVTREYWLAVLKRLQAGEMPPKDRPRPSENDVRLVTGWINQ